MGLEILRRETPEAILSIIDLVWSQPETFIRWPKEKLLWLEGVTRESRYHKYAPEKTIELKEAKIQIDCRSNGPAICAFLLAGGERPPRRGNSHGWSIHHIYDGKFPSQGKTESAHAVKNGRYFTQSAGLVAIHPIADALADEVPYFAWLLRAEAYKRFNFDPDGVFSVTD